MHACDITLRRKTPAALAKVRRRKQAAAAEQRRAGDEAAEAARRDRLNKLSGLGRQAWADMQQKQGADDE
jgi:hypothetical protein